MRKNPSTVLAFVLLALAVPVLSACHTVAGAGQDVSATGRTVTNAADRVIR